MLYGHIVIVYNFKLIISLVIRSKASWIFVNDKR